MSEARELCKELKMGDITIDRPVKEKKAHWKDKIKKSIQEKNEKDIKKAIERYDKLEVMKKEEYGMKSYIDELNMTEARTLFRVRSKMIKCKMNQSSDGYNKSSLWKCEDCGYVDTQSHILNCPA